MQAAGFVSSVYMVLFLPPLPGRLAFVTSVCLPLGTFPIFRASGSVLVTVMSLKAPFSAQALGWAASLQLAENGPIKATLLPENKKEAKIATGGTRRSRVGR